MAERRSWIDEATNDPLIDDYAQKLDSFLQTFEDGRVDEDELKAQENRVTTLMKEVEPQLNDELHEKVTQLLCELSAYDIMQFTFQIEQAKPAATFQG